MENPEKKIAIALKYSENKDQAPEILASGVGAQAEAILNVAAAHDIPIKENTSLAQSLTALEVKTEIPKQFYEMVSEVLWFVHRLDEKWQDRPAAQSFQNGGT